MDIHWFHRTIFTVLILALMGVATPSPAEILIPSQTDKAHAEAREKAFIPWSTPDEGTAYWKQYSSSGHVPIFKEFKAQGTLGRDLYIPNPGTGYWVLGGLSEKALWKTHHDKLKGGDELISAMPSTDDHGVVTYWALWAPASKAYLLKEKMAEYGITPARVELTTAEKLQSFSETLTPYTGLVVFGILAVSLLTLILAAVAVGLLLRKPRNL